jgi:hypothetical protein
MQKSLSVGLFIVFLPLLAMAQKDFDGTWKVDLTKSAITEVPVAPIQSRVFESTAYLSILAESKPTITAPSTTITGVVM